VPKHVGAAPPEAFSEPPLATPVVGEVSAQPAPMIENAKPEKAEAQKQLVRIRDGSVGRAGTCQSQTALITNSVAQCSLSDGNR
jgi:hypothetical protein